MTLNNLKKKLARQAGFTILEIMISITILATMVSVLLTIFAEGVTRASEGESSIQAMIYAQSKMDEILLVEGNKLDSIEKVGEFEGTGYTFNVEMSPQPYHGSERNIALKHIILTVAWNDGDGERDIILDAIKWTWENK